ncbi:MAG TPA: EpsI family protein [Steroidobacteraceae bacterium]|jgi:EpsI family protein|nr:EpsI family protein [Steroidobacteraceae bacterium]
MIANTGERLAARPAGPLWRGAHRLGMAVELAVVAVVCLLFAPTIASLRLEWIDTVNLTYTHGYLVCAVCIWLLWRAARAPAGPIAPDARLVAPLCVLSLFWLVALRAGIELLHQVLFPAIVFTALCAAVGLRNGARYWFACAYLYFAIPVWTLGTDVLQAISTFAVKIMLALTGVSAHVDGNIVQIPEGAFEIAGGCSGVHYFIVAIALAAIFGEVHRDSIKVRLRLALIAAVLAFIANWVRIYVVIIAGHLTNMQHYLVRVDHYVFGWALYALSMGVFFWIASRTPLGARREAAPLAVAPPPSRAMATGVALALVAAATGPAVGIFAPVRAADARPRALLGVASGWTGPAPAASSWKPNYPNSDRSELGEYQRDGAVARAFVAEYDSQRQGKELVGFDNSLLAGLPGEMVERRKVSDARGSISWVRVARSDTASHLVAYYYDVAGSRRANAFAEQITYGIATLTGPVLSRIVAVEAECSSDCAQASASAIELLRALDPASAGISEGLTQ